MYMTLMVLAVLVVVVAASKKPDFCPLNCNGKGKNSACSKCKTGKGIIAMKPTYNWRMSMLKYHNELRDKVASGKDTEGGNGEASDMLALSYDMDLEFVVGCYLYEKCRFEHDKCRATPKYKSGAGQNIYTISSSEEKDISSDAMAQKVCDAWYGEIVNTTAEVIEKFDPTGLAPIGHFTQMVWAKTGAVGCAACEKKGHGMFKYIVACNYGPAGNFKGEPVYIKGTKASACPDSTKANEKYDALCGDIVIPKEAKATGLVYPTGDTGILWSPSCFIITLAYLTSVMFSTLFNTI